MVSYTGPGQQISSGETVHVSVVVLFCLSQEGGCHGYTALVWSHCLNIYVFAAWAASTSLYILQGAS
jgi:hypothetical protein